MANLERQMEEELGLYPRSKYIFSPVQDSANLLDKEIAEAEAAGISQEPPTASDIADTVIDFTPVIGDIKGAVEGAEVIFEELAKDDPNFLLIGVIGGAGVVGLIPGVGDAAQKLIIKGARRFKKTELNPEVMEILTPKDQETVEALTKNTLSTPETDGEKLADEVAAMLREGKAGDITEEMLETAGNDFHTRLTQNYIDGNVGMDLPMDWESTMARAADQGLTETRYHGSNVKDIPFFKGEGAKRQTGMFNTDDPFKAFSYEGNKGETYSLLMRPLPEDTPRVDVEGANWSNLDEPSMNYNKNQLSPDVRQGPRMDRQAQPLDEFIKTNKANLTSDMFMQQADTLGYPGATIENVVDRGPSTPTRFSKEQGIQARSLAREPSETQARTDTTGIRSIGARFDPRLTGLKNINMAQGGLTSMNEQTQMAFALGGEAETVDPVSGNDVPPGSLPEEVRDDIDAKLSEGEYVVPADVVRFFGVKLFEDLRMQAKIGLQQMDADGRIGGEPVPAQQEDSMDVAELKAALSKSGMYAGGLAKGDTIDSFIDDASRDPMVNGRMRANGATVKMAVGGLVPTGTYGDVNKVDGLIKQLMTAANKDPNLMKRLASKGITLNKTGADQDANEMKKTNRPKTPIKASAGTYINYSNNYEDYNTLGAKMFMDANIGDPKALINSTLLSEKGEITQITLITPDGTEIPVAWNTSMPIPEGFSVKGEEPEVNDPDKPKGLAEKDDGAEQRAQDAIQDKLEVERFNYSIATPEELYDKLRGANTARNIAAVAGTLVGPVGMVISAAASFNNAIVTRRIEIELKDRIDTGKIDPETGLENAKGGVNTVADLMSVVNTDPDTPTPSQGFFKDFFKDLLGKPLDSTLDKVAKKGVLSDAEYYGTDITPTTPTPALGTPTANVKDLGTTVTTDKGSFRRFSADETKKAQKAGVVGSFNKMPSRPSSEGDDSNDGGGLGISKPDTSAGNYGDDFGPGGDSGGGYANDTGSYGGTVDESNYGGYTGSPGGRNTGGLIAKPANKKQNKKRKTQRRKGLGTRP